MAGKEVTVQVNAEVNDSKVKELDAEVNRLKQQQLQLRIDANSAELKDTESRIKNLKIFLDNVNTGNTNIHIDDSQIQKAKEELASLEGKKLNLEIAVAKDELASAKAEEEALNGTAHFDVDVDGTAVQGAMQNITDGISQAKQGLGELADGFMDVMESAGQQETNFAFLKNAVGDAKVAQEKMDGVNKVVQDLPGDDTALQGLLSSAVAKDAKLTTNELENMGTAATDYFSAMSYYGKSSTEAQQDMTNYLLAGNTAELERSPILQGHIDKLKEANTIQERSKVLQEALNEEHWGGMSQQDTYNNKLATFQGMIDRGKYKIGGMFQEATKGGMDFVMKLDEISGGLTSIALGGLMEFGPGLATLSQGIFTALPGIMMLLTKFGGLSGLIGAAGGAISGTASTAISS